MVLVGISPLDQHHAVTNYKDRESPVQETSAVHLLLCFITCNPVIKIYQSDQIVHKHPLNCFCLIITKILIQ